MSDAAAVAGASIEELIGSYQERRISRRRLLAALSAAGASAAVAAALLNAAEHATPPGQSIAPALSSHHQTLAAPAADLAQAHAQHISNQVAGTTATTASARAAAVARMLNDYSPNAVVNDPLFGGPLAGTAAIAVHKTAEMAAISEVSLQVLSRAVIGAQVVSTWVMSGLHDGPYYNLPATGKRIALSGVTVQTRGQDGRIITETLYYDAADMRRQLTER
jgi:steroid delta-isomerase-like uncharacterized protein